MPDTLIQSLYAFALLLVGFVGVAFVGREAAAGADLDVGAAAEGHAFIEAVVPVLAIVLMLVVAIVMLAFGRYLMDSRPGGSLR